MIHRFQAADFLLDTFVAQRQLSQFLSPRRACVLSVDADHFVYAALYIGFEMSETVRDLSLCEGAVTAIDGLELAPFDGDTIHLKGSDPAAELDKLCAGLANGWTVALPEIRNGLVVGLKATGQPHHLNVPAGLALKTSTGQDPV